MRDKAQSVIEYVIITTLVMVGILIAGPYAVRAINAYFHHANDQVEDSFREEITQAPETGFDFDACSCSELEPQECGDGINCEVTERVWQRTCTPLGCEISLRGLGLGYIADTMQTCEDDPTCCTPWELHDPLICGVNAAPYVPPDGCDDGHALEIHYCGSLGIPQYKCTDHQEPQCVFTCSSGLGPGAEGWCDPDGYYQNLWDNIPTHYVNNGLCADPGTPESKCLGECLSSFIASSDGLACECPPGFVMINTSDACWPPGCGS